MKFIKNEEEFKKFFSSSLYNKIVKESTTKINRNITKEEFDKSKSPKVLKFKLKPLISLKFKKWLGGAHNPKVHAKVLL